MKTHKASAKRFRVTGSGKIMRRRAGKQHLLGKKNTKRKLRLSKMLQVNRSDYDNVIGALPYLKDEHNTHNMMKLTFMGIEFCTALFLAAFKHWDEVLDELYILNGSDY
ncbi:unnamed protein product [Camellia sinensis]